jgi:hypothetical protein
VPTAGHARTRGAHPTKPGRLRSEDTTLLDERELLRQLVACECELSGEPGGSVADEVGLADDAPRASPRPAGRGDAGEGPDRSRRDAVRRRYFELDSELATGCL